MTAEVVCFFIGGPFGGAPHLTNCITDWTFWLSDLVYEHEKQQIEEDYKKCIKNLSK